MLLYVVYDGAETVQRLRRLAIEADVAVEIQALNLLRFFYHDGTALGLSHKSENLGMTVLAEDDNLLLALCISLILLADALLQMKHHGAGGIDDVDVVLLSLVVG